MPYLLILLAMFNISLAQAEEAQISESVSANNAIAAATVETAAATDDLATEENVLPEKEAEVFNVFTPEFMNALHQCKPASDNNRLNGADSAAEIVGQEAGKCHLRYADFDLFIPLEVLPNIHGFDDLQILLRNPEMAKYNFKPQYIYNGILHALNSCAKGVDYLGTENKKISGDKQIRQALEAEFANDVCTIYLVSELEVEGVLQDYTVTCRIDSKTIAGLLNYYRELLDKYGEKRFLAQGKVRVRSEIENEQTRQADDELMFFLQQKGYCE